LVAFEFQAHVLRCETSSRGNEALHDGVTQGVRGSGLAGCKRRTDGRIGRWGRYHALPSKPVYRPNPEGRRIIAQSQRQQ
jgi:hypothetical protein